jgi:hypothetical protein
MKKCDAIEGVESQSKVIKNARYCPCDSRNQTGTDCAGGCWGCERVAQLNSCRISFAGGPGGVSAGCLGSTSKLLNWLVTVKSQTTLRRTFGDKDLVDLHDAWRSQRRHSSTPVLPEFPSDCRELGNAAYLEITSDICTFKIIMSPTLNDSRQLVVLVEVEQLFIWIWRGRSEVRISFPTEGNVGQVKPCVEEISHSECQIWRFYLPKNGTPGGAVFLRRVRYSL